MNGLRAAGFGSWAGSGDEGGEDEADAGSGRPCVLLVPRHVRHLPPPEPPALPTEPATLPAAAAALSAACAEAGSAAALVAARASMAAGRGAVADAAEHTVPLGTAELWGGCFDTVQ